MTEVIRIEKLTLRLHGMTAPERGDVERIGWLIGHALADAEPLAEGHDLNARHLAVSATADAQPVAIARAATAALIAELRGLG